ncbi:MAG: glycosyl hydrolase, partial [Gemmatimonadetes bacterium]|nr:glycosyl hydrolase [Gemmatimonadota bacterium]
NRLFRSDNQGTAWRAVSPDLTRQIDRNRLKLMGRVWSVDAVAKNTSTPLYGSIVTLAESPPKEGLLWVGTDDGLIQESENGGGNWRRIEHVPGVPDTTFVSRVEPSQHNVNTGYASFDNHKAGDYQPYIAKSTDLGRTWTVITGNLPERGTVYAVIEDHKDPNLLFAGTEFGLFFTNDGGKTWTRLRGGLPTIQVRDLAIQKREDDLVVATFGRSFYVLDDLSALRSLTPSVLAAGATLFPVKRTPLYVQSSPLGGSGVGWQGGRFYSAQNPPFGAVFTYYLKEEIKTRRARRQAAEREAARAGRDVFYPPWDSLKVEDREEAPAMILTVTDPEGRAVRRLTGPVTAGTHRVAWDLRYPPPNPPRASADSAQEDGGFGGQPRGPYVVPGAYRVTLAKRVDGVVTPVGGEQAVEVYPLDGGAARSPAVLAFQQKTWQLQRAVLGANAAATEVMVRIQSLKRALQETPGLDGQLGPDLGGIETRLRDIQEALNGDPTVARRQESTPPSLSSRLGRIAAGAWSGILGDVTDTHKRQYDIVAQEFGGLLERLRALVEVDLKRAEDAAEAAGAPWTSGRVPRWPPQE